MTQSRDVRTECALAFGRSTEWILTHIGGTVADIDRAVTRMNAAAADDDHAYRIATHHVSDDDEALIEDIAAGKARIPKGTQSPELIEAVRRLAATGYSDPLIGARTYRSTAAIRALRLRHNIPPGRNVGRPAGWPRAVSGKRRAS